MAERETPTGQLYLIVPPETPVEALQAALEAGPVACALIRHGGLDDATLTAAITRLCPVAQDRGIAVLAEDRADLAKSLGCDGVHLSDPAAYSGARGLLGQEAIVGVACGASRHHAMVAGEKGADYVAFGRPEPEPAPPEAELIAWWQMTMTVPCVALGARSAVECAALAAAGADFVGLGAWVWDHPDGPTAAVRAAAAALATSGGTPDLTGG